MPTYLYSCPVHNEFEEYHSIATKLEWCPKCQEEGLEPQHINRLINSMTKGVVELFGNDLVQKVKSDAKQLERDAGRSEKLYSNLIGETTYQNLAQKIDRQKR